MKKYLLVWEVNDLEWKVVEKGNFYMRVPDGESLEKHLMEYSESMSQSRGIKDEQFIITYCQQL